MPTNLPPFYPGQKVVAIYDHSMGRFKKGDEFCIHGIKPSGCKCGGWEVNIGLIREFLDREGITECHDCNFGALNPTPFYWFSSCRFAPVKEQFATISYTKILEEENKLISVN